MADLRFTAIAKADIADVLDVSFDNFGPLSRRRYEALIATALDDLELDPAPFGSTQRPDLGPGIRTYHLRYSQKRGRTADGVVRTPRHLLVYKEPRPGLVLVLRLLHDSMELERHIPPESQSEAPD